MAGPFVGQIFIQGGNFGFTETHYPVGTTYAGCMSAMQNICTARMALANNKISVAVIRVSDLNVKGDSFLAAATTPVGTYIGTTQSAEPDMALMVSMYSSDNLNRARHYLRGLPEDQIGTIYPIVYVNNVAAYQTALNNYLTALTANAQLVQKKPGPLFTTKAIGSTGFSLPIRIRRVGRPFSLPHGRRLIV